MRQKYVPQALRSLEPPKVKMPVRKVLNKDPQLIQFYKESLLLYTELSIDTAERLLDSEITMTERIQIQKAQNELYDMVKGISRNWSEKDRDLQDERIEFVSEIVSACTLVKPKMYQKIQAWFIERIKLMHNLK